jgi:hypothetical protein
MRPFCLDGRLGNITLEGATVTTQPFHSASEMGEFSTIHVDAYWASTLGCTVAVLRPVRGLALPHAGFGSYDGVYALTINEAAPIVSGPQVMRHGAIVLHTSL